MSCNWLRVALIAMHYAVVVQCTGPLLTVHVTDVSKLGDGVAGLNLGATYSTKVPSIENALIGAKWSLNLDQQVPGVLYAVKSWRTQTRNALIKLTGEYNRHTKGSVIGLSASTAVSALATTVTDRGVLGPVRFQTTFDVDQRSFDVLVDHDFVTRTGAMAVRTRVTRDTLADLKLQVVQCIYHAMQCLYTLFLCMTALAERRCACSDILPSLQDDCLHMFHRLTVTQQ
jgi:hypothetical protein